MSGENLARKVTHHTAISCQFLTKFKKSFFLDFVYILQIAISQLLTIFVQDWVKKRICIVKKI